MPRTAMFHEKDPREEIFDKAGDLSGFEFMFNKVLVGIYQRPAMTKGGIHMTDETRAEDLYQGKSGMVLKLGFGAFNGGATKLHDTAVEVGDWVMFRPSNGIKLKLGNCDCILLQDAQIEAKIPSPDVIF